jgi:hypothetical protein
VGHRERNTDSLVQRPAAAEKANRSEICKFRARGLLLVIILNWLEVGLRNPPTEHPET